MALVPAICTQCGAKIEVDSTHEAGICKHCGTAFITEKAINNYNTTVNNNFNGANVTFNVESEFERELKAIEALIKLNQNRDAEYKASRLTDKYPHEARAWLLSAKAFEHYLYKSLESQPEMNMLEAGDSYVVAKSIRNAYALGDESVRQEIDAMRERYMTAFKRKWDTFKSTLSFSSFKRIIGNKRIVHKQDSESLSSETIYMSQDRLYYKVEWHYSNPNPYVIFEITNMDSSGNLSMRVIKACANASFISGSTYENKSKKDWVKSAQDKHLKVQFYDENTVSVYINGCLSRFC